MADKQAIIAGLREALPGVEVITNAAELITYRQDAGLDAGAADGIAFPRTTEDVVKAVRWAKAAGLPLIARGAGTGVSGGAVAEHGGLLLGFSRMNAVLSLDAAQRLAIAQPGLVNLDLNRRASREGLCFPPDPSSGHVATIGGNVAENAGGPHCFKYGVTTNYVLGLEVVLADGSVIHTGGPALDYPEYDLTGLLSGSEGTLGIITAAYLRLIRAPAAYRTLLAAFDSLDGAGDAVSAIIAAGLIPAALEMIDARMTGIIEAYAHAGLPVGAAACIVIEVDGHADGLAGQMDEIVAILHEHGVRNLRLAGSAAERDAIWKARKSVGGAVARLAPSYYSLDTTVPRSRLAETLGMLSAICDEAGLRVGYALHAGDGNLHPHVLIDDPSDPALMKRVLATGSRMMKACVDLGGTITGEHGVGIEKRPFMAFMYGRDELAAMEDVKAAFDPGGLLNPGKIFPPAEAAPSPAVRDLAPTPLSSGEGSLPAGPTGEGSVPARPTGERSEPVRLSGEGSVPAGPSGEAWGNSRAAGVGVLAPATPEEAAEALRSCAAAEPPVPVRVRGGGTKSDDLPGGGVLLSTRGLGGIKTLAPRDLYVVAGAGLRLADLQAALAGERMWVPIVSPWPEATVGGILSANFNAPLRMRYGYGAIRDQALAVTVALPDGRVIRAGRPLVKNVAGYDLPKAFIGAHGTLGLIADVALKLQPLPRLRSTLLYPVEGLDQGCALGRQLLRVCAVASALLLCRGADAGLPAAAYALVYTAEGFAADVRAELAEARAAAGPSARPQQVDGMAGSDLWAAWLAAARPQETVVQAGVAPKDVLGVAAQAGAGAAGGFAFMADLAGGLLYLRRRGDDVDVTSLQQLARGLGGYARVLRAPAGRVPADPWGWR